MSQEEASSCMKFHDKTGASIYARSPALSPAEVAILVKRGDMTFPTEKARGGSVKKVGRPTELTQERIEKAAELRKRGMAWDDIGPAIGSGSDLLPQRVREFVGYDPAPDFVKRTRTTKPKK